MKNIFAVNRFKSIVWVIIVILISGCGEYFDNPIVDKETGEDINLLIIDFNFFTTNLTYKLLDASDGTLITQEAKINFTGKNANDIVTYSGEKQQQFLATVGQIELTVDPNISFSESNPFEFAINVNIEGYQVFNKGFQLQSEGKKTIELNLTKIVENANSGIEGEINIENGDTTVVFGFMNSSSEKSAQIEETPYKINYSIEWNDFLKLKDANDSLVFSSPLEALAKYANDRANFASLSIDTSINYLPGIDVVNSGDGPESKLFQILETGRLDSLKVNEKVVADLNGGVISSNCEYNDTPVPPIFGFAVFSEQSWVMLGTETVYDSLNFSYTLIKASDEVLCGTGSSITFRSSVISSFSIDADVYDLNNNFLTSINFKGNFPETFVVENTPSREVKLVFRNNNPGFSSIDSIEIENFCEGNYEIDVSPNDGYLEYQIVLTARCKENKSVAIAPTYSAEIKIKGSDDLWQGVDMIGGVVDLLGKPNQEYELRLLWKNAWEYSTYFTQFDDNGNYLGPPESGVTITSQEIGPDRIQISIEKIFEQNICNDIGW